MPKPTNLAQTLERTNSILDALNEHPYGLSLGELAQKTELAKSTVHRLLASLIYFRFVRQDAASKAYFLGFKLVELGNSLLGQLDIRKEANPFLVGLSQEIGETVHLVIQEADTAIYIDKVDQSAGGLQMASRVGMRIPLYSSAVGKVLLAHMEEEEARALLADMDLRRLTDKTIVEPEEILRHIRMVKERGYAIDDEENENGICCVAAPIKDNSGKVVAAMSTSGSASRITLERIEKTLGAQIVETAMKISCALGYFPR